MKIYKKVLSRTSDQWLLCCWQDCERDGFELFKVIDREHQTEPTAFVFCSERHKHYWLNSHVHNGMLPAGMRNSL